MFSYFRGHFRIKFFRNIYYVHLVSIVLPLTVKIVLNLISQSYTRSRIFCGMFFYFELHSKLDWGGFFSIFIVVSMMKDSIFKKLFLQRRSRDFSWRNNDNNNLLLNLMCHLCYSSMCAYLTIYLHQTSSFSVVHTYSGPLTIVGGNKFHSSKSSNALFFLFSIHCDLASA